MLSWLTILNGQSVRTGKATRWLMKDRGMVKAGTASKAGTKPRVRKQHTHRGELFSNG